MCVLFCIISLIYDFAHYAFKEAGLISISRPPDRFWHLYEAKATTKYCQVTVFKCLWFISLIVREKIGFEIQNFTLVCLLSVYIIFRIELINIYKFDVKLIAGL